MAQEHRQALAVQAKDESYDVSCQHILVFSFFFSLHCSYALSPRNVLDLQIWQIASCNRVFSCTRTHRGSVMIRMKLEDSSFCHQLSLPTQLLLPLQHCQQARHLYQYTLEFQAHSITALANHGSKRIEAKSCIRDNCTKSLECVSHTLKRNAAASARLKIAGGRFLLVSLNSLNASASCPTHRFLSGQV